MTRIVQDLVNAATAAALDAAYHKARAERFKAAAVGEAERLRAQAGGAVRELTSDQRLGSLRLDASDLPASPIVDDPDALGEWLAQRPEDDEEARGLVHAAIAVPLNRLEEALEVLRFAGFRPEESAATTVVADREEAAAWLRGHCRVMAAPDLPSGWCVVHGTGEERVVVPGAVGVKPASYWVLRADDDRRREYVATAQAEVDGFVADLRARVGESRDGDGYTVGPRPRWTPPDPEPLNQAIATLRESDPAARVRADAEATVDRAVTARRVLPGVTVEDAGDPQVAYEARTAADLRAECRERTLLVGGTKAELVDRLLVDDRRRAGLTA